MPINVFTIVQIVYVEPQVLINNFPFVPLNITRISEIMFQNDNNFIKTLQEEQRKQCRIIMESSETIGEEQVLIVCEAVSAIDDDKELLNKLTVELRKVTNIYKQKATFNKRKVVENVWAILEQCWNQFETVSGQVRDTFATFPRQV